MDLYSWLASAGDIVVIIPPAFPGLGIGSRHCTSFVHILPKTKTACQDIKDIAIDDGVHDVEYITMN